MKTLKFLLLSCACMYFLFSCKHSEVPENELIYEGPLLEAYNIETFYTDSAKKIISLNAKVQFELQNKDREFPKGVLVNFYDNNDKISSILTGDYGYYYDKTKEYKVSGNVVIDNFEKGEKLQTEELFWYPENHKVKTDEFVRITTPDEILMGEGLVASDDFSSYKILKPTGVFSIENEDN